MRLFLLLLIWCCTILPAKACFIMVLTQEDCIMVANHEDWFEKDSQIRILPSTAEAYGSIIFTFASEGWAQGGMNEKGLFFDGALTPLDPLVFDSTLVEPQEYIWQKVLNQCATVEEAIALLKQYQLPELEQVHIVLADATGRSVILGTDHGKITFFEKEQFYQIQTNFNKAQPELGAEPPCERYGKAVELITQNGSCSFENAEKILSNTHQGPLTVYSNIYDLKNRRVQVYHQANFSKKVRLDLDSLMQLGYQEIGIASLFEVLPEAKERQQVMSHKQLKGHVLDALTNQPIPYVNLGIINKGRGTISDLDGSFVLNVSHHYFSDTLSFSAIGYDMQHFLVENTLLKDSMLIRLKPKSILLEEVIVEGEAPKLVKAKRWGWMGGKNGILPLDTAQGGAAVAVLVEGPETEEEFFLEKIWFRISYSSEDTFQFRLRLYGVNGQTGSPGAELLEKTILLKGQKRVGWEKFDLSPYQIFLNERNFFMALEWINPRQQRDSILTALVAWEQWKKEEYEKGNPRVHIKRVDGEGPRGYQEWYVYKGDMQNWPGFDSLPGLTALVVDDDRNEKNKKYLTYFRRQSLDEWKPYPSVLNMVVRIKY